MRPVLRGEPPLDSNDNPVLFSDYKQARDPLLDRIGDYCSYCEIPLSDRADVEHIRPKNSNPDLSLTWDNFLLACTSCNSIKGTTPVNLDDYYWPDQDNTFRAFVYPQELPPEVAPELNNTQKTIAEKTLHLTGLDRAPGSPNPPTNRDRRWRKRLQAWGKALRAQQLLTENDHTNVRESIVDTATSTGFWSVWMTVFHNDTDMHNRFIDTFPGSRASASFDQNGQPVVRPGGRL